jgi:dUTP pyrophosphatase
MVKFEKVNRIAEEIRLPERSTLNSAGYDFFAVEDAVFPAKKLTRVMTGVKCELMPDMVLILANRSSNPSKKGLILANGVGVIDADYYGNPDNDGEMGFEFYNILDEDVVIKKGEKLGQGIILNFIKTENDHMSNPTATRVGGFGSTGV